MDFEKNNLRKSNDLTSAAGKAFDHDTDAEEMAEHESIKEMGINCGEGDAAHALDGKGQPNTDGYIASMEGTDLPGAYYKYINEAKMHDDKARDYERKANKLENDLKTGKTESHRVTQVKNEISENRQKARYEKVEAEKCRQAARQALYSDRPLSFAEYEGAQAALEAEDFSIENELNDEETVENASVSLCRKTRTPQNYPL